MRLPWIVGAAGVALFAAACGTDSTGAQATTGDGVRTVAITMDDNKFDPDAIEVRRGETVRFEFTNDGTAPHDAFIGDRAAQDAHEEEMRESEAGGHGGHGAGSEDAITVEPGETGTITYVFDEAGNLEIGCHELGHYDDGMTIDLKIT